MQTFDGLKYSVSYDKISSSCLEYKILVIPNMQIEIIMQLSDSKDNEILGLKIIENSSTFVIESVNNFPHLTVNYTNSELLPYKSDQVMIEKTSSKSVKIRLFGTTILWIHDESNLYVNAEPILREQTFGLCGTFDFKIENDFKTLNGDLEQTVLSFVGRYANIRNKNCLINQGKIARSQRTESSNNNNKMGLSIISPCIIFPERVYFAKTLCNAIKTSKIFKDCDPEEINKHVEMCEFGACQTDNSKSLCSVAAALARKCQVKNWRSTQGFRSTCQPKCPENMIFEECINIVEGTSDAKTCTQLWTTNKYFRSKLNASSDKDKSAVSSEKLEDLADKLCIPGCKCSSDLVLDDIGDGKLVSSFNKNFNCIPKTACPCLSPDNNSENSIVLAGSVLKRGCIICTCYYGKFNCNSDRCGTEITCPRNLVYQEEVPACLPKTCKSLRTVSAFSQNFCETAPTYAGCTCPEGTILLEEGTSEQQKSLPKCVKKSECPCYHNGQLYKHGTKITKGCTSCVCNGVNWSCSDNKCVAKCSMYGTPHYSTFDGNDYEFLGPCSYILARSKYGSFSITSENVPCGISGQACTKSIYFNIGHMSIHLLRGKQVTVNNVAVRLPKRYGFLPNPTDDDSANISAIQIKKAISDIEIKRVGSLRTIINAKILGLTLIWDGRTTAYIYVKPKLRQQLGGLCGDYDNRRENDYLSRQGAIESHPTSFANSWRISQSCSANNTSTALTVTALDNCQAHPNRLPWAREKCYMIYSDIFQDCHELVNPDLYYRRCINDACTCSSGGDCECLCTAIGAYSNECSEHGVAVKWRSNELCPIQCDGKLEYYACGSLCEATCDDLHAEQRDEYCKLTCVEGCFCPPGYVRLNDDECVRPKQCPCKLQGATFPPGTILEKNCQNCTCIAGRFNCIGIPCNDQNRVCQNQLTEFYCEDNNTCIPYAWKCDGVADCPNSLDEHNCKEIDGVRPEDFECRSPKLEFKCHSNLECIPKSFVCDGSIDCIDGSDEKNCIDKFKCLDNEFTCKNNGRCIKLDFVCDGQYDCGFGDYSDEIDCVDTDSDGAHPDNGKNPDGSCRPSYFQCLIDQKCIPRHQRCNGNTFDCADNSDEFNCHCPPFSHFECADGLCLLRNKVCDGFTDCKSGEDEAHCDVDPDKDRETTTAIVPTINPQHCTNLQVACRDNKKCLPKVWLCDGQEDCEDGSDELGCKPKCQPHTFSCDNGITCLRMQLVCDGHIHCLDKSDENVENCGLPKPKPCSPNSFLCQDNICINDTNVCDGIFDCSQGEDESNCSDIDTTDPDFNCSQYTCLNGKCLNFNQVCNGINDCQDGSLVNYNSYFHGENSMTSSDEVNCGQYNSWSSWSSCSETCGSGVQFRSRKCLVLHEGKSYDVDQLTFYELTTFGIDPLRMKCPGKGSQVKSCHNKPCQGKWSPWTQWTECTEDCSNQYKSRTSRCENGVCLEGENSNPSDPNRRIIQIGKNDKIEIELCDKNCDGNNKKCTNGQIYFSQRPEIITCRDLNFMYQELNSTANFESIKEILSIASSKFVGMNFA